MPNVQSIKTGSKAVSVSPTDNNFNTMKSRIRSRWHRANEKPLEKDGSVSQSAPIGEIDPSQLSSFTDDLSNFQPVENFSDRPKSPDHGNDRRRGRSRSSNRNQNANHKDRKPRSNPDSQNERQKDTENISKEQKRRPRKRRYNQDRKSSGSTKHSNTSSKNSFISDKKSSQKSSGLKGFLGKLFG